MRLVAIAAIIPVAIIVGAAALDYLCGRTVGIPIANFFPLVVLAGLLMLASWLAGAAALVTSAFRGKRPLSQFAILGSSVLLSYALFTVCLKFRPYLVGLRHNVFAAGTPDEFRDAAQVIHQTLDLNASPLEGRSSLPGPAKDSIWKEARDRPRWNEVTTRAPCIARLHPSVWIFRYETYVSFVWGGALMGHAGFNVGPGAPGGHFETLRTDNDITFFMGH